MTYRRALGVAERMSLRQARRDRWQLRQCEQPTTTKAPTRQYGSVMPSAADRVRFSRFVERALKGARERGMTDPQIEKATGIRASTFHRWRRGDVAPTVDKVRQFCAGLGLRPDEALAALGMGQREATPEPPMDPDVAALLRKLEDPNTNKETKEFIRTTLRHLVAMPVEKRSGTRRKAS